MSNDPIFDVYRRFEHLDRLLTSDMMNNDMKSQMLRACWQAIKDDLRRRGCAAVIREEGGE